MKLLGSLGISCVKAPGEAEAFCAHLNSQGVACGVVTQDSDVFLYGAKEVYRNLQLSQNTCDVYTGSAIEGTLGLTRKKLVALALLTGCDYSPGVPGVGKEQALKFLKTVSDEEVLDKFSNWKNESIFPTLEKQKYNSNLNPVELFIREKALRVEGFPHLDVIEEFFGDPGDITLDWVWEQPNTSKFVAIAVKKLNWDEEYALQKFLPILARWHLRHEGANCGLWLTSVMRKRTVRGKPCYEVTWDSQNLNTTEPRELVCAVYPNLVEAFEVSESKKAKKPKKSEEDNTKAKGTRGRRRKIAVSSTLDGFVTRKIDTAVCPEMPSLDEDELNLSDIINVIVNRKNSNPAVNIYRKYKHSNIL